MTAQELDKALATKPRAQKTPSKIWVGFSVNGGSAKVIQDAFQKAGITNRGDYVRGLVLTDLKKKLGADKPPK